MATRKIKLHCVTCLTKNDLILVTTEKHRIISSLLDLPSKKVDESRICINCNSTLACIDKFRANSLRANAILEKCKLKTTFLSSVTDESVNSAFDTILNWMNDVTVILRYLTDVKAETVAEKESESESVHEYESFDALHEEELFVGSVEGERVKKEEMLVEGLDEMEDKYEPEMTMEVLDGSQSTTDEDDDTFSEYIPEVEKKNKEVTDDRFKKYTCDVCGKKYAGRSDLTYHMNVHSGKVSIRFHVSRA